MVTEKILKQLDDGWTRQTFINTDTSTVRVTYLYKGKHPASVIHFHTKKARHLAGYQLIDKDLRDALLWIDHINEIAPPSESKKFYTEPDSANRIAKGLFKAAVINYIKAYDLGDGRFVSLNKAQLPVKLQAAHTLFYDLRNNYIAHGGLSEFEKCEVTFAIPPRHKLKSNLRFSPRFESNIRQATQIDWEKNELQTLISASRVIIEMKIKKLQIDLSKEFEVLNYDKIYKATKSGIILTITDRNYKSYLR